jgi:hypothetical protein
MDIWASEVHFHVKKLWFPNKSRPERVNVRLVPVDQIDRLISGECSEGDWYSTSYKDGSAKDGKFAFLQIALIKYRYK